MKQIHLCPFLKKENTRNVIAPLSKCRDERSEFYGSKEEAGEIL